MRRLDDLKLHVNWLSEMIEGLGKNPDAKNNASCIVLFRKERNRYKHMIARREQAEASGKEA